MTPWGIRNRIKGLMGQGGANGGSRDEQLSLTMVLPGGATHAVKCESKYTLVMASQALETPIATGCPDGACGGCGVEVLDGTGLAPPLPAEQTLLDTKYPGQGTKWRMACHARVIGSGSKVRVLTVWRMDDTRGT